MIRLFLRGPLDLCPRSGGFRAYRAPGWWAAARKTNGCGAEVCSCSRRPYVVPGNDGRPYSALLREPLWSLRALRVEPRYQVRPDPDPIGTAGAGRHPRTDPDSVHALLLVRQGFAWPGGGGNGHGLLSLRCDRSGVRAVSLVTSNTETTKVCGMAAWRPCRHCRGASRDAPS